MVSSVNMIRRIKRLPLGYYLLNVNEPFIDGYYFYLNFYVKLILEIRLKIFSHFKVDKVNKKIF